MLSVVGTRSPKGTKMKSSLKKYIAYYRVSTKKQAKRKSDGSLSKEKETVDAGLGLQAQKITVSEFAGRNDGTITAEYTEVESGKNSDRPKLKAAIQHAKMARAILVVAKLDRLARNVAFTSALMDSGIEFVACDNPHATRLTLHILAAVAENEALAVSRRTKDALAVAKTKGVLLGSARPGHWDGIEHKRGWKKGAKNAAKARTQRAASTYAFMVPRMQEMRDEQGMAFQAIADVFNEEGHQTSAGKPFTATTVWRILKRAEEGVAVA